VDYPRCEPAQPGKRVALVEIPDDWHNARRTQQLGARRRDVSAIRRKRDARRETMRSPTSPQPTISRRGRPSLCRWRSASGDGAGQFNSIARFYELQVTVRPSGRSFSVEGDENRARRRVAAGRRYRLWGKNGACGTCRGKLIEGQLTHGPHAASALSAEDETKGLALFCCSRPQTDVTIEARELTGFGDIPIKKMPARIARIERVAPDVANRFAAVPATERCSTWPGSTSISSCATARVASIRLPPRRTPTNSCSFTSVTWWAGCSRTSCSASARSRSRNATSCGSKDRWARFSCVRTIRGRSSSWPRYWLCADQGACRTPLRRGINREDSGKVFRPVVLYWGARSRQDLYLDALPARWRTNSRTSATNRAVRSPPGGGLGWSHGLRAPCGHGRLSRPFRSPGVCLRRAFDDRRGTSRLRIVLRPARRSVLR